MEVSSPAVVESSILYEETLRYQFDRQASIPKAFYRSA